jgi:hypothetical protein
MFGEDGIEPAAVTEAVVDWYSNHKEDVTMAEFDVADLLLLYQFQTAMHDIWQIQEFAELFSGGDQAGSDVSLVTGLLCSAKPKKKGKPKKPTDDKPQWDDDDDDHGCDQSIVDCDDDDDDAPINDGHDGKAVSGSSSTSNNNGRPESADIAADPVRARVIQMQALFEGAVINYAPNVSRINQIITLANRTFDDLGTIFSALRCMWKLQHTRFVVPGETGMLIDRWFNTGSENDNAEAAAVLPAMRPPDGSWVLQGGGFKAPPNIGEFFGTRIRGVFVPVLTGNHHFMINSDDAGVLFLSDDRSPKHKRRIAENSDIDDKYRLEGMVLLFDAV